MATKKLEEILHTSEEIKDKVLNNNKNKQRAINAWQLKFT